MQTSPIPDGWKRTRDFACYLIASDSKTTTVNHLTECEPTPAALDFLDQLIFEREGIVRVTGVISKAWIQTLASLDFVPDIVGDLRTSTWTLTI